MIRSKKSFEIQFNWIFVLLAGAAIVIFFSVMIAKQKTVSDSSARANALRSFESIVAGAESSLDTTNAITFPDLEINVRCGSVSIGDVSRQYSNMIVFSSEKLMAKKLITKTSQLNIPYRAANLLSITSAETYYSIIGIGPLAKKINETMHDLIKKETRDAYPASGIKNSNSYRTRIVLINPSSSASGIAYSPRSGEEASLLEIRGDENKGTLVFYSKPKPQSPWIKELETGYIGFGMLSSAIYSDSSLYECSKANALKRAESVTRVYIKRTQELLSLGADCETIYSDAILELEKIRSKLEIGSADIAEPAAVLKSINSEARKMSCPLVY